ncbi:MAG: hypothetical protein BBJ57_00025 [Desulfobacterales bacterium PC51MH44]|nr:MAG: hypothetical protein BBJ57_00025 [Desulfobacterales bacterium PC51MH44]
MYLSYYNLKTKPFQMSTDPNFLWLGEKHKEALATLKYAILENKGVLALTGDVGTGKTTLINALIKSLGKDTVAATIYDPSLEIVEFFNIVAAAFNIDRKFSGKGEFLIHFRQFLKKARARNEKVLLIIDEAQRISAELLEEMRLLTNLEAEHIRLLNIFFVGQNEFIDILQENRNRALRQRITLRYHIEPLTLSETEAYIRHRLEVADAKAPIFSSGAIQEIFSFSSGYPRLINIICDHALLSGYVMEVKAINTDIIRECKAELQVSTWMPGQDTDLIREKKEEPQISERIPVQDADHLDKDESRPGYEAAVIQEAGVPKPGKKRISLAVLGIAFLVYIGFVAGYLYYDTGKTKTESPGTLALRKYKVPHSGQVDSKNNKPIIAAPQPETPPTMVEAGKAGDSHFFIVRSPEPKLLKEIAPKEAEKPAAIPSDQTADKTGRQVIADSKEEPETPGVPTEVDAEKAEASRVFAIKATESESIKKITSKKAKISPAVKKDAGKIAKDPETTQPQAEPVQEQKGTLKVSSAPSKKQATRLATKSSGDVPEPMTSSEKAKQVIQAPVAPDNASTAVAVPEEKKITSRADQKVAFKIQQLRKPETSIGDSFRPEDLQHRLKAFLTDYCRAYENKQLDKFSSFFTPDAVEKGKLFSSYLSRYRRNFEKIDSMNYRIDVQRYAIQDGTGLIRIDGTFNARARLSGSEKWRQSSGRLSMELASYGDSFRVKRLDY